LLGRQVLHHFNHAHSLNLKFFCREKVIPHSCCQFRVEIWPSFCNPQSATSRFPYPGGKVIIAKKKKKKDIYELHLSILIWTCPIFSWKKVPSPASHHTLSSSSDLTWISLVAISTC
jgi:hypothetical protein